MKKIGIINKSRKTEAVHVVREFVPWLESRNFEVLIDSKTAEALGIAGFDITDLPSLVDAIVVLGGDGTMLSVARLTAERGIPIIGVNMGGLGFITEFNKSEICEAIEDILSKESHVEERIMLVASIYRNGELFTRNNLLNDIVINKGALARIFDIETYINSQYVTTFKSDGLIVSTPTGSTAYSLSAGGPILYPTLNCIVITPICPHTLTNRPIVIKDDSNIEIVLKSESKDVFLTIDGQVGHSLENNDIIRIQKSVHNTRLVVPSRRDYFQILREKLKWGER